MESNSLCCHCRHIPAKFFCICTSSLLTFCASCENKHKAQSGFHHSLPLHCRDNIRPERLHILKSLLEYLSFAQRAYIGSLSDFDKCGDEINLVFKEAAKQLEEQRSHKQQILQGLKNRVSQEITAAVNETQANCMNEEYTPTTHFANEIWQLAQHRINVPSITLLSYKVNLDLSILPACVQFQAEVDELASEWLNQMERKTYPSWIVGRGLEMEPNRSVLLDISGLSQVAPDTDETQRALERGFLSPSIEQPPIELSSQMTYPIPDAQRQNWECGFCGTGPYPEDATMCHHCGMLKSEQGVAASPRHSPHSGSSSHALSPHISDLSLREQFESSAPTFPPLVDSRLDEALEELQGGRQAIPDSYCRVGMREKQKPIRPSK